MPRAVHAATVQQSIPLLKQVTKASKSNQHCQGTSKGDLTLKQVISSSKQVRLEEFAEAYSHMIL